jgi:hypothetical protein
VPRAGNSIRFRFRSEFTPAFCDGSLTAPPVLKQVHPDTGISNRAMSILNSFVNGEFGPRLDAPCIP